MAYSDLQDYLALLRNHGKLHWIDQPVDPSWEVSAITRHVFDRYGWNDRPALGFRHVGDSPFPLVIGVVGGSPQIYALALSTTVDEIPEVWERAQRHPIDPMSYQSACARKSLRGALKSMSAFLPQVVWTPSQDPGPYITAPLVVTKDPETGRRNVGTYRLQMKGPQQLGFTSAARSTRRDISGNTMRRKEDMPVAIAIGVDPTIVLASISEVPLRHR